VVNDDGPPSNQSSPYVHSLVKTLQAAGHNVSVCLPNTQRSWIGKAHLVGKTLTPTYFTPGTLHKDDGITRSRPFAQGSDQPEEWILVDGTPASCVQIGLYHFFQDKGPIDMVISGPNYGRNSTAVFGLSSGTLGGALEAAVCKKRAFALSYAFDSRNHDPIIIAAASRHSVKVIEHLYKHWDNKVDLYSINVPLVEDVEKRKILQTDMLQNYWGPTSCFEEAEDEIGDPDEEEQKIREGEEGIASNGFATPTGNRHKHKHFKWAPKFVDVHRSVDASEPGNDGWAVKNHYTRFPFPISFLLSYTYECFSVTPLRANFMHALPGMEGELKL